MTVLTSRANEIKRNVNVIVIKTKTAKTNKSILSLTRSCKNVLLQLAYHYE